MKERKLLQEIAANTKPLPKADEYVGSSRLKFQTTRNAGLAGRYHEYIVPDKVQWNVRSVTLTCARGGAGTRTLGCNAFPDSGNANRQYWSCFLPSTTIDVTTECTFAPGMPLSYTAGFGSATMGIPDLVLRERDGLVVWFTGSVATDTCTSNIYYVETDA